MKNGKTRLKFTVGMDVVLNDTKISELRDLITQLLSQAMATVAATHDTDAELGDFTVICEAYVPAVVEIPESLRGRYRAEMSHGAYDNVVFEVATPQGHRSVIRFEAENENLNVSVYCPDPKAPQMCQDDVAAICRIAAEGAIVYGNNGDSVGLMFNGDSHEVLNAQDLVHRQRKPFVHCADESCCFVAGVDEVGELSRISEEVFPDRATAEAALAAGDWTPA